MATYVIEPDDRWDLADLLRATEPGVEVRLSEQSRAAIARTSDWVEGLSTGTDLVYGVNTGFGALADVRVRAGDEHELQLRHILSHACGVGDASPPAVVRMMLLIKLLTFRTGQTGVSLAVADRLVDMLNHGVHPVVPERGTVGASGDLSPLAHLSLPLIGRGSVEYGGEVRDSADVLRELGWPSLRLTAKDGLALTNGTQYITSVAVVELGRIVALAETADLVAAMSLQAFSCADRFFHERYHRRSGNAWRRVVAESLREHTLDGNHASLPTAVPSMQDPYSFRCIPQVHGAAREHISFARSSILNEVDTVADNPLFFPDDEIALFGGNLHGESVAISADLLAIAVSELGSISERRTYQLLSGRRGLPDFLTADPGVNSGLMIVQYTSAALVNEMKTLCHPASVDSIPTCQLQEDHVSMGGTSVLKLRRIVDNLETVLAIEWLTACQAVDLREDLVLSARCRALHHAYREVVGHLAEDRVLSDDIVRTAGFIRDVVTRPVDRDLAGQGAL
ncbi:aromatic amino acid ammonia-lyase [Actinosynnema sp. NPDC047251]|uniref:Histidine ammonia-lyase n=1 Tax=Saccharothrix espanaensis (strain ATCC 51144 / DSM 44229 / JCM 9112 / NBRC 15066 / NRRL 15764) TaxID=1179773 RepID=K0JZ86_SACES|nr:aromatic amino acid ammonia-lyase [Saccharothrix espanaensis]CCH29568.1 Histidine ammonia-lyase [Saccharothrix espanaensis DSM 44229]